MIKLTAFQVLVIERGKEGKGEREDVPDRLVTPAPVLVLAADAQAAALQVCLDLDAKTFDRQRLEVLARPF
jgi:hypothetical protein